MIHCIRRRPRLARGLQALALCAAASSAPLAVHADTADHAAHNAEEAAGHDEHHHGPLHLNDVLFGEKKLEFWGAVVNFVLLVFVIRKLAKAPLGNFLNGRSSTIEKGIAEATEVKRAAEAAFATYTERMKSLDSELSKLRKEVSDAAERDRARIVEEANQTVTRLQAETEALIKRQAEQLETQIRREVVAAATAAAEKAVSELTTPEDQLRLADAFVRELAKVADQNGKSV